MPAKKILMTFVVIVLAIVALLYWQRQALLKRAFTPTISNVEIGVAQTEEDIQTVAENLDIPWEVAFLPDGTMLVTERPGQLLKIGPDRIVIPIQGVKHTGEGGLLGLAVHPNFSQNSFIYLYLTTSAPSGLINRVERYQLNDDKLTNRQVIIDNIPGASHHDGGRISFGPDGLLYITTGDAGTEDNAQNKNSLAGKILRLNDDGSIPSDNPFGTAVYSYGHRNPQGLAWDAQGLLWATEHGRSGIKSGFDELNQINPGQNYGWPIIQGDEAKPGLTSPAAHSGPDDTWAPAGAAIIGDSLFFAGLRGESLYEAKLNGSTIVDLRRHLTGQFGRLRAVTLGPDGWLYLTTSNTDGRAQPNPADDKIIKINPTIFQP